MNIQRLFNCFVDKIDEFERESEINMVRATIDNERAIWCRNMKENTNKADNSHTHHLPFFFFFSISLFRSSFNLSFVRIILRYNLLSCTQITVTINMNREISKCKIKIISRIIFYVKFIFVSSLSFRCALAECAVVHDAHTHTHVPKPHTEN